VAADFIRHAKPHPTAGVRKGIGCSRFHPAEHRQALTSCLALRMEKHAFKRPLESEGIPPLIENPEEAMEIFAEILRRGAMFYTDANDATQGHQRVHRIVKAQGNPSIVIVGAVMTKLLHIIYGMLKHGQPLRPFANTVRS
jgi:hypothetical protein